jgi:hypothetical protein
LPSSTITLHAVKEGISIAPNVDSKDTTFEQEHIKTKDLINENHKLQKKNEELVRHVRCVIMSQMKLH